MNRFILILSACVLALVAPSLRAQSRNPEAYRLVDSLGRPASFDDLLKRGAGSEVVFFGELHNNPIAHWLQLRVLEGLHARLGDRLSLGLEMLESDTQLILDEYLSKTISPKSYGNEGRLWPNYETDYDPVVYYAKDKKLRVWATNIPRRYADLVNREGPDALLKLSDEAKRYMAPLPLKITVTPEQEAMMASMSALAHGGSDKKSYLNEAQASKDATMAWFISRHVQPKHTILHLNGSYHSLQGGGIIPYLRGYAPGVKILTITTVLQEDISKLEDDYLRTADYIIIVPEDMTRTH